jgi:hypothetical protein
MPLVHPMTPSLEQRVEDPEPRPAIGRPGGYGPDLQGFSERHHPPTRTLVSLATSVMALCAG